LNTCGCKFKSRIDFIIAELEVDQPVTCGQISKRNSGSIFKLRPSVFTGWSYFKVYNGIGCTVRF
jgi:hypothetical protein